MPIDEMVASTMLRAVLARTEVERWEAADCAEVVAELSLTEKACAGVRALAAARLAGLDGAKGPDWLARERGVSPGAARKELDTARAMDRCPETKSALRSGELSLDQAAEIAAAEKAVPGSEPELVDLARTSGLGPLRERSRSIRLSSVDPEELHRRQHGARSVRHWTDREGMACGSWRLPPETGVALANRLEAETDRVFRQAHRDGRVEPREAYAADAFLRLLGGQAKAGGTDLVVVCDLSALQRGHVHPGEVCHIVGGGPIPVSVAQSLGRDAFVKAVLHDGTKVDTIAHYGRHIPAELRTLIGLGPPPGFAGAVCSCGCGRRDGLENDHLDPVANGGVTAWWNIDPKCRGTHREKTERDRQAGRLGKREQARDGPRAGPGP